MENALEVSIRYRSGPPLLHVALLTLGVHRFKPVAVPGQKIRVEVELTYEATEVHLALWVDDAAEPINWSNEVRPPGRPYALKQSPLTRNPSWTSMVKFVQRPQPAPPL